MKSRKLIYCALGATVMASFSLVGCEEDEIYKVNAPANLQDMIDEAAAQTAHKQYVADSIAAAKAAAAEARFTNDVYQVGATDNSSGFWGDHSKYYRLETTSDTVYVKFKNFTNGDHVWCNWICGLTSDADRGGDGYVEYAIWRADNYSNFAWGAENGESWNTSNEGDTHGTQQTCSYASQATSDEDFSAYTNMINGADCSAIVTRGGDSIYVNTTMKTLSGATMTKSFYIVEKGIKDKPVRVFWTVEKCHLVFYKTLFTAMDHFAPTNAENVDPNWNSGVVEEIVEEEEEAPIASISYAQANSDKNYTNTDAVAAIVNYDRSTIGAIDNSCEWWTAWSSYYTIEDGQTFTASFTNYSGVDNWNNWVAAVTTDDVRGGANYAEYFCVRSDKYGWGNPNFVLDNITISDGYFDDFHKDMNGAEGTIEVSNINGLITVTSTFVSAQNPEKILVEKYSQQEAAGTKRVFFIADHSHFNITMATWK